MPLVVRAAKSVAEAEPELDRLSNILKTFNDQFGTISWSDVDRVHKLITEDIPNRVPADTAYQNAKQNSDKQNARIERDKALAREMTAVLKDDTELFKQFMDNDSFKRWMTILSLGLSTGRKTTSGSVQHPIPEQQFDESGGGSMAAGRGCRLVLPGPAGVLEKLKEGGASSRNGNGPF